MELEPIRQALQESIADASLSRRERRDLKPLFAAVSVDRTAKAKVRQMAFRLAAAKVEQDGVGAALSWLEDVIKQLYASEMEVKASAYFSPGEDCLHRIRRLIGEARSSLDICVFTITDDRIVDRLVEAKARGVVIRIISDNDKSEDHGSDLDRLVERGFACRFDRDSAHMHHKFAIADNDLLLTGSYNWTRSAAAENDENIVVTNHRKLVDSFAREFDRMWHRLG